MNYKNIENFEAWLTENLKFGVINLDAVLEDVERSHDETGSCHYELPGYETISGNPECYYYDAEYVHNEEEDSYECTIIF